MFRIEGVGIYGFEEALRGMRHPMKSGAKGDSIFRVIEPGEYDEILEKMIKAYEEKNIKEYIKDIGEYDEFLINNSLFKQDYIEDTLKPVYFMGPNDLLLAYKLTHSGHDSHEKFLRQIYVIGDINGPLYWWKEIDQYKIGTVTNSESTMHKLVSTPITKECFSVDDVNIIGPMKLHMGRTIDMCEDLRKAFLRSKNQNYWRALIQLLPSAWNQKRTWSGNYAVLKNIYDSRKNHKLNEWREMVSWIETLPYSKILFKGD